nr:MAG TPA: hypothetical protein [Caudoviricetes sp.]
MLRANKCSIGYYSIPVFTSKKLKLSEELVNDDLYVFNNSLFLFDRKEKEYEVCRLCC